MVAIISGEGLGLYNSNLIPTGLGGGNGGVGSAGGSVAVNTRTGNLVLQFLDERLSGTGADLRHLRTYNSQGLLNDGDGDAWRWEGERRVTLNGTLNTAGSTVTLTNGDGYQSVYTWTGTVYQSTAGSGAHDTLSWNAAGSEWVWNEGGTGVVERYHGSTGWIKSIRDGSGNGFDYTFSGDRLTKVVDIRSGQTLELVYGGNGKLARLDTRSTSGGALTRQVYYNYDTQARLSSVVTDLTPNDNSISDGQVYTTSYTYDGSSLRIASISQSDGTQASFTYQLINGQYRIHTVTGPGGVSTFSYDTATGRTDVQNGAGDLWSYYHTAQGQLSRVESQPINGVRQSANYSYDAQSNLTSVTDGRSNIVTYSYDAHGNRIAEKDSLGNTVTRTYDSQRRLVTETRYAIPHATAPGAPETTRYIYDTQGRLRYTVSAEGRVSENRYNVQGLLTASIQYAGGVYNVTGLGITATLSEAQLNSWIATQDKTKTQLTEYAYDYRGNLSRKRDYADVNAAGAGIHNDGALITHYIYDQHGQLLQTLQEVHEDLYAQTSYAHDGLGRRISVLNGNGQSTTVYNGNTTTLSNSASGLTTITTTDSAGRIASISQSGNGQTRVTRYIYDAAGRLRMTEAPSGARSYVFYDQAGRISFKVDASGAAVRYAYDADGRVLTETAYANRANTASWYNGTQVTKTTLTVSSSGSPDILSNSTHDRVTTYAYDAAGRLSSARQSPEAAVTSSYNGASQLTQTNQNGALTKYYYDKDGRLLGTLNAERNFVENIYDSIGRLIQTVRYNAQVTTTLQNSGTFAQIKTAVQNATSLTTHYYYDAQGREIGRVNEHGFLQETVYNAQYTHRETKQYLTAVTVNANDTLATLRSRAGTAETTRHDYDIHGRLIGITTADGTRTAHEYDTAGRLVQTTQAVNTSDERRSILRYNAFSDVTGMVSGVGVATGGSGGSAGYQVINVGNNKTVASATGFLNTNQVTYGFMFNLDGQHREFQNTGQNLQTYGAIINSFNAQFSGQAEALMLNGNLVFRSLSIGSGSSFVWTSSDGDEELTSSLAGFIARESSVAGGTASLSWTSPQSAINTAISNYGVRYELDGAGRRIAELHPNGQKTLFYYDANGRVIYTVNALGEVKRTSYNAYGEVASTTAYTGRISTSGLTGGADTTTLETRLATIVNLVTDSTTTYAYTKAGRLERITDAEGYTTSYTYNSRGHLENEYRLISTGVTVNTHYDLDLLGRITATNYDNGGITARTMTTYDGVGRILATRDPRAKWTNYAYSDNGRTITITDPLSRSTKTEYDAYGRVLKSWDGNNQLTSYNYDTVNRRITVTTPDGVSISTWKTRTGETLRLQDGNGGITEYTYTKDGNLATVTDAKGIVATSNTYDNSGRLHQSTDANGVITQYSYDAANRVLQRAVNPTGLNLRTSYTFDGQGRQVTVTQGAGTAQASTTEYRYDRNGRVHLLITDPAGLQLSTRFFYDGLGNTVLVEQGSLDGDGRDQVTQYTYDKLGRKIREQKDPDNLNITTDYKYDENGKLTRIIDARGNSIWFAYDAAGQLTREIDSLGGLTRHYYDNSGRLTETVRFFNTVNTATLGDDINSNSAANNPSSHANDAHVRYVYDVNGRLRYTLEKVDSSNWQVSENRYDNNGNVIETRRYDKYLSSGSYTTEAAVTSALATLGYTASNSGNATRTLTVYDANNRARYTLSAVDSANWVVTESLYDSRGNVIETRRYDQHLANSVVNTMLGAGSPGGVRITDAEMNALSFITSSTNLNNARRTFFAYDAANRLRFTVNALAHATENVYDAVGNITAQTQFWQVPVLNGNYSEANINSKVNRTNTSNRTTQFVYDKAGRLKQSIDALNKSEYFSYDTVGNKTAYTNKNGAVWNYVYDAVGRLTREISPAVNLVYGPNNTAALRRLSTEMTYDALGNVLTRTEGILVGLNGSSDRYTGDARTTSYQYDALGRQIKTTLPGWYNPATGRVEKTGGTGRFQVTSEILYDTLGNAVRNAMRTTASSGGGYTTIYQYKTYDGLGRLVHEIDALRNVTSYTYQGDNIFTVRRSASTLTATVPGGQYWTAAQVSQALPNNSNDRVIEFTYDRLGRKTSTIQKNIGGNYTASATASSNPATVNTYTADAITRYYFDAFGQVVTEETRVNQNDWRRTFHFYDKLGRETATVQSAGVINGQQQGYVTRNSYDALGNLIQVLEYANTTNIAGAIGNPAAPAMPAWPTSSVHNRYTHYGYDKLNRQTYVEKSVLYFDEDTSTGFDWETNEFLRNTYDNVGNITEQRSASGAITRTEYDALGRVVKVTEPSRVVAAANAADPFKSTVSVAPVTNYTLDAFGNAILMQRSAPGAMNGGVFWVMQKFDHVGNMIETTNSVHDGDNVVTRYEYDVAGRVTKDYQFYAEDTNANVRLSENRYHYDVTGRQLATTAVVTVNGVKQQSGQRAIYNAFGEITMEIRIWGSAASSINSLGNESILRTYSYDTRGRVFQSEGSDGVTRYYYDLSGNVTRQEQRGNGSTADGTGTRITETIYDLMGRAVLQRLPSYTGIASALGQSVTTLNPKLSQTFDRWGNVLSSTDAASKTRHYVYNHSNQVVRETLPTTAVYRVNGSSYVPTMTREYHYNSLGQVVREVDKANGTELRARTSGYDTIGQLLWSRDATTSKSGSVAPTMQYLYDAMGNRVASRNALGTVYIDTYDIQGQQIERAVLRLSNGAMYNSYAHSTTPVKVVLNTYYYDYAGRRTHEYSYTSTLSNGTTNFATGAYKQYTYNELGNLTQYRNETGITTNYKYDAHGNKVEETNALGYMQRWTYSTDDYGFGHLATAWDISNVATSYVYNDFGQLIQENKGAIRKYYAYHQNGLLKSVDQVYTVGVLGGTQEGEGDYRYTSIKTDYDYDIRSNRVREIHSSTKIVEEDVGYDDDDYNWVFEYVSLTTRSASFTQLMSYDELNRLSRVKTLSGGTVLDIQNYYGVARPTGELVDLTYRYDEFGNRRNIVASYRQPDETTLRNSSTWYTYDLEGRILIDDGVMNGSSIGIADSKGVKYTYDAAGQRKTEESFYIYIVDEWSGSYEYRVDVLKTYNYNDFGLLNNVLEENTESGDGNSHYTYTYTYAYDLRGNQLEQSKYYNSSLSEKITSTYFNDGRIRSQITRGANNYKKSEVIYYDSGAYDAVGNLRKYRYLSYKSNGSYDYTHTYTYNYQTRNGEYKQNGINVTSTKSGYTTGRSNVQYDVFGNLVYTSVHTGNNKYTYNRMSHNNDGQIIYNYETRTGISGATQSSHLYVNGNAVGKLSNKSWLTTFVPVDTRINPRQLASTPSQYVLTGGETLQTIAQTVYGNSSYWYLIADANGLSAYGASDALPVEEAGRALNIPNVITNAYNDVNTFKPYNPGEIIGDLTPAPVAPPPPKNKSNAFAAIVMIVVAVVVTVFTAGAAAVAMGAAQGGFWAAGTAALAGASGAVGAVAAAAGGFVGSLASQGVGKAMGVVDDISLRTAFASGLTAGFSAGIGSAVSGGQTAAQLAKAGNYGKIAATASLNYAGGYVANKLAGLDASFSWSNVAVAAASSMATSALTSGISTDNFIENFARGMVGAGVNNVANRLAGNGSKMDWRGAAVDAFGNALGNAIVEKALGGNFFGPAHGEASQREQTVQLAFQNREVERLRKQGVDGIKNMFAAAGLSQEDIETFFNAQEHSNLVETSASISDAERKLGIPFEKMTLEQQAEALSAGGAAAYAKGKADVSAEVQDVESIALQIEITSAREYDPARSFISDAAQIIESAAGAVNWLVDKVGGPQNAELIMYGVQALLGGVPKALLSFAGDRLLGEQRQQLGEYVGGLIAEHGFGVSSHIDTDPEHAENIKVLSNTLGTFAVDSVLSGAGGIIRSARNVTDARMEMVSSQMRRSFRANYDDWASKPGNERFVIRDGEQRHHVLPLNESSELARTRLKEWGLDINDPSINGVNLPGYNNSPNPLNKVVHAETRSMEYRRYVNTLIEESANATQATAQLSILREQLLNGQRPWL